MKISPLRRHYQFVAAMVTLFLSIQSAHADPCQGLKAKECRDSPSCEQVSPPSGKGAKICQLKAPTDPPATVSPTAAPTASPSVSPTAAPSASPTATPTASPSRSPVLPTTVSPTAAPTVNPTSSPSSSPTSNPTASPTVAPTFSPTSAPTSRPTSRPTANPTAAPSRAPTDDTSSPTVSPTSSPTASPSAAPTASPSASPTANPTSSPTSSPTASPTKSPVSDGIPNPEMCPISTNNPNNLVSPGFNVGTEDSQFDLWLDLDLASQGSIDSYMSAYAKWKSIIGGDSGDKWSATENDPEDQCSCGIPTSGVEDLYICGKDVEIDGQWNILGSAGATHVRPGWTSTPFMPIAGVMRFDVADVDYMIAQGRWESVVLHEMAHVMGIGSIWHLLGITDGTTAEYTGQNVKNVWENTYQCTELSSIGKPNIIEMDGGSGTAFGHFDETCFGNELMTGTLNSNTDNPLSEFTIAALADIGYQGLDYSKADAYSGPSSTCCTGSRRRGLRGDIFVQDGVPPHAAVSQARAKAIRYGKSHLNRRRLPPGAPREQNGALYVGDLAIKVLYFEDDGSLQDVHVTQDP